MNEPNTYTMMGYALGQYPPGRCSEWQIHNCLGGNAATEPYIVGHNLILAHAHAVKVYRDKYQVLTNIPTLYLIQSYFNHSLWL